ESKVQYMNAALPKHLTPERLARVALTAISSNPRLLECTKESLALALIEAGQLGLEPNGVMGQAYLVPYFNGKTKKYEAQFQVGYRGLIDLARRSGEVTKVEARAVREGDYFEYEYGLTPQLVHRPDPSGQGEMTHVYAIAWLRDAGPGRCDPAPLEGCGQWPVGHRLRGDGAEDRGQAAVQVLAAIARGRGGDRSRQPPGRGPDRPHHRRGS